MLASHLTARPDRFRNRLYFVRHGETDWNVEGRLQGQSDVPLNGRGRDQASAVGHKLRDMLPAVAALNIDFYVSPLTRTRQTMALLRAAMALPPEPIVLDDRLKEIAFGQWEGQTWKDIRKRTPGLAQARLADRWGNVPPDGESYAMVAERIKPWLRSLSGDTLVVAHGGIGRVLLHLMTDIDAAEATQVEILQGRVLIVESGKAKWV